MSYDLYCYPSKLGRPDLQEALDAMEVDIESTLNPETAQRIVKALTAFNPGLEVVEYNSDEEDEMENDDEPGFEYIEMNTPEGDLQITIFENSVSIEVPYRYTGNDARTVFGMVHEYSKIVRQTVGYFVYDPQSEHAYDPLTEDFGGLDIYTSTSEKELLRAQEKPKKPWWKFW